MVALPPCPPVIRLDYATPVLFLRFFDEDDGLENGGHAVFFRPEENRLQLLFRGTFFREIADFVRIDVFLEEGGDNGEGVRSHGCDLVNRPQIELQVANMVGDDGVTENRA